MSDPFCPECNGTGMISVGGIVQSIDDDSNDESEELTCPTCNNNNKTF